MKQRLIQENNAISFLRQKSLGQNDPKILFVQGGRLVGKSTFINKIKINTSSNNNQIISIDHPIFYNKHSLYDNLLISLISSINNSHQNKEIDYLIDSLIEVKAVHYLFQYLPFYKKKMQYKIKSVLKTRDLSKLNIQDNKRYKHFLLEYLLNHLYPKKTITFFIDNVNDSDLNNLDKSLMEFEKYFVNEIPLRFVFIIPLTSNGFAFLNNMTINIKIFEIMNIKLHPIYIKKIHDTVTKSLLFSPIVPGIIKLSHLNSEMKPTKVFQTICNHMHYASLNHDIIYQCNSSQKKFLAVLSFIGSLKIDEINYISKSLGCDSKIYVNLIADSTMISFCGGYYSYNDNWRAYLSIYLLSEEFIYYLNEFILGCIAHIPKKIKHIRDIYFFNYNSINPHINQFYQKQFLLLFKYYKLEQKKSNVSYKALKGIFQFIRNHGHYFSSNYTQGLLNIFEHTQQLNVLDYILDCFENNEKISIADSNEIIKVCAKNSLKWNDLCLATRFLSITRNEEILLCRDYEINVLRLKIITAFHDEEALIQELTILAEFNILYKGFDIIYSEMSNYLKNSSFSYLLTIFEYLKVTMSNIENITARENKIQIITRSLYMAKNIINTGDIINSNPQFHQGNEISNSNNSIPNDILISINDMLEEIKKSLSEQPLNDSLKKELSAEAITLESQITSPKPKIVIISESLKSLRNIFEGAAGSLIASGIYDKLPVLIQQLENLL